MQRRKQLESYWGPGYQVRSCLSLVWNSTSFLRWREVLRLETFSLWDYYRLRLFGRQDNIGGRERKVFQRPNMVEDFRFHRRQITLSNESWWALPDILRHQRSENNSDRPTRWLQQGPFLALWGTYDKAVGNPITFLESLLRLRYWCNCLELASAKDARRLEQRSRDRFHASLFGPLRERPCFHSNISPQKQSMQTIRGVARTFAEGTR